MRTDAEEGIVCASLIGGVVKAEETNVIERRPEALRAEKEETRRNLDGQEPGREITSVR